MEEVFKVLIADDEYWTREKLKKMIAWEQYHLKLLKPAEDGEEVLVRMEEEQPDILITDINMPFLNGVELLKIIKEKYPEVITFVISGYDDFDYVKETFMAGSINYLVKPVSKIDLVNAVVKALELISNKREKEAVVAREKGELLKAASVIQDREFSHLLEYKETFFTPNITMNSNMDFAGSSLVLIKIHNLSYIIKKSEYDMNTVSFNIKERIRDIVQKEEIMIFNHIYRSNEFIIISELENRELTCISKRLLVELGNLAKSPITIAISEHSYSMDSIYQAYVQTVSMLMTRTYTTESCLLCADSPKYDKGELKSHISEAQLKELQILLKAGNDKGVRELIFERVGLVHCEKWEYLEVRQTVRRIFNILTEDRNNMSSEEFLNLQSMTEMVDKTIELLDVAYLCEVIEDILENILSTAIETSAESMQSIVHQAAEYIQEHYFEALTLSGISKQFHVEHSYFSRIFKKEMGVTLMLYIAKIRIEKAKEYIRNSDSNLTEIAFMVGYDDYTYFNKVFRKHTGISPRDYKRSIEAGDML